MKHLILIAFVSLALGCSPRRVVDLHMLPIDAEVLDFGNPANVSRLTRHELLMTRHQWDHLAIDPDHKTAWGRRGNRQVKLVFVVGAEGVGMCYDWVLLRTAEPIGNMSLAISIPDHPELTVEDIVCVVSGDVVNTGPQGAMSKIVFGTVQSIDLPAETDCAVSAGTLVHVALQNGTLYPGSSGSPAAIWCEETKEWTFLGILVGGNMVFGTDRSSVIADGRYVTILRPPAWVFDLLTPDEPKVTWPSRAVGAGSPP